MTAPTARAAIEAMLHPRSIAIVGATERPGYGSRLMRNLIDHGYRGRIVPVNPGRSSVYGITCLPGIADVEGDLDLAVIAIPAEGVATVLAECGQRAVPAAVVVSAGYAETGTALGRTLRDALRIAAGDGPRVCGPNCLGIANVGEHLWATANVLVPLDDRLLDGGIAIVSQSGATAFGPLLAAARDHRIGIAYVVSSGNEDDLTTADYIEALLADRRVTAIACVVEGVQDGAAFRRALELAVVVDKPVVILKIGRTDAGSAAALSHTAAVTGADDIFDALLRQIGVPRVHDWEALVVTADLLARARRPIGRRVGVVSHSGGVAGLVGDACAAAGLEVPALGGKAEAELTAILEGRGAARNPADVTLHVERESFAEILSLMLGEPAIDALAIATAGSPAVSDRIAAAASTCDKPIVACWTAGVDETESLRRLRDAGIPTFHRASDCAGALAALADWSEAARRPRAPRSRARDLDAWARLQSLLERSGGEPPSEHDGLALLQRAGVRAARSVASPSPAALVERTRAAALRAPFAVKIDSPDLLHKSDVGGVALGIGIDELEGAAAAIVARVREERPEARLRGLIAQEMAPRGLEVLLGLHQDPSLGPSIVLGLGGLDVEALRARAFRLPPFGRDEAEALVDAVPGLPLLLEGGRGRLPYDRAALIDAVEAFAAWAVEIGPSLTAAELNPLVVLPRGEGVIAVDCLIEPAPIVVREL